MIPYGRQDITEADIQAVIETLKSDFITQGPAIPGFEKSVADFCGAAGAVAVSSATAGLHVAYLALGIGPGRLVWTVPNTFAATANAALYCGADVDFVDIDLQTRNLCVDALAAKLEVAEKSGRLPDLVVPVHFSGLSCDMAAISALAKEYGFRVVEDASHAIGGAFQKQMVGACQYSDAAVFSFHPVKIITTGEGGMITSASPEFIERCAMLRSHGITKDQSRFESATNDPWFYEMQELGFNYRLTDIQATLGRKQMERLEDYVSRRNQIAEQYTAAFSDIGLGLPAEQAETLSARHLYTVHWPKDLGGLDRREAFDAMRARGLGVNVHYIPVHLLPFYRRRGYSDGQYPNAEMHYKRAISLPLFPTMTNENRETVIKIVCELCRC